MADDDDRPACKYGAKCYRRNEEHKERFSHPPKDKDDTDRAQSDSPSKHLDSKTTPPAKRRKTVSSHGSDDSDAEADEQSEIESTSNGSAKADDEPVIQEEEQSSPLRSDKVSSPVRCSEFIKENFDKGPHAQRAEHQKLLESPALFIRSKFLVEMPADFYEFWSFCEANAKGDAKPENLFSQFGLSLVGPFDVLAKKFDKVEPFEPGEYLRHWRFYYDPPEFQVSKQCAAIHLNGTHTMGALFDETFSIADHHGKR